MRLFVLPVRSFVLPQAYALRWGQRAPVRSYNVRAPLGAARTPATVVGRSDRFLGALGTRGPEVSRRAAALVRSEALTKGDGSLRTYSE